MIKNAKICLKFWNFKKISNKKMKIEEKFQNVLKISRISIEKIIFNKISII